MARLLLRPAARRDLVEIGDWIARDNRGRAASFVAEIEARMRKVAQRPGLFPARDDVAPGLRAARHGNYLIFFFDHGATIEIVRVLHGARDLTRLLSDPEIQR